jgi:hypothetical protein
MNRTASLIKIGAVVTATPRWVAALLLAEGFVLPEAWLSWWIPISAILSAGMAITEALAFAFIFEAWRNQSDKKANVLLIFAGVAAFVFIGVVSPYIVASVRDLPLADVLSGAWLWLWASSVAASTIVIVAAVGYAQKSHKVSVKIENTSSVETATFGKLPEKSDWRTLPAEDKQLISGMTAQEVVQKYAVSERTAYNWKQSVKDNLPDIAGTNGHKQTKQEAR